MRKFIVDFLVYKQFLFLKPSQTASMKIFGLLVYFTIFISLNLVQSLSMPHANFADKVSDPKILHQLTHHHRRVHEKHKTSRISKILKFQMDKILRLHNRHMEQGNMSKSHRAEFERKLKIKFNHIKNYSKKKLRKDYEEKKRSRRYKNFLRPRRA